MQKNIINNSIIDLILMKANSSSSDDEIIKIYYALCYMVNLVKVGLLSIESLALSINFSVDVIDTETRIFRDYYYSILEILNDYDDGKKGDSDLELKKKDLNKIDSILSDMGKLVYIKYKDSNWYVDSILVNK